MDSNVSTTITLPSSPGKGFNITILQKDTGDVNITGCGTIETSASSTVIGGVGSSATVVATTDTQCVLMTGGTGTGGETGAQHGGGTAATCTVACGGVGSANWATDTKVLADAMAWNATNGSNKTWTNYGDHIETVVAGYTYNNVNFHWNASDGILHYISGSTAIGSTNTFTNHTGARWDAMDLCWCN